MKIRPALTTFLLFCTALSARAQPAALDMSSLLKGMSATAPSGQEEPPPYPKFEDITKGMESEKGLFTLWHYPDSAKDKDTEKLLCQIPASFLGQKFMLSTSIAGGGFMTGFPLDEQVVKWEQLDKQLVLIEPETLHVIDDKGTVSDAVKRTYPDRIRAAVPILTKSPSGDPVIDLSLLKGNFADIGWMSYSRFSRFGGGGGVNPSLSKWLKKKAFDLNIELTVELAVGRSSPPGSYDKRLIHYSIWKLPQTDYKPRIADDRVGYFLTANEDWSKPTDARDLFNRYIDRWNLVKRDPSLAKCEPKEPIIYYIEKTVPVRFRKAVRDGILEWNKAFEKIGFVDAVQVRQQTDDNEWKDLDPEDMRYSFFRWIVTGGGFAMGPHRSNPFTGQIYDADIVFDDSMVRFIEMDARQMLPASLVEMKMSDPAVRRFMRANPAYMKVPRGWENFLVGGEESPAAQAQATFSAVPTGDDDLHCCDYARGMMHQMIVATSVMPDLPKDVMDRLLYEAVREIVTHEVGHTLGLRHNFKASSIYTVEQIKQRRLTGEPLSGSVMDYNPIVFSGEKPTEGSFVTPTIGPWDHWVIEYGYRPADGDYQAPSKAKDAKATTQPAVAKAETKPAAAEKCEIPPDVLAKLPPNVKAMLESSAAAKEGPVKPPSGEEGMLSAIAARAAEPELAYATDEDTTMMSPDPRSNRYDAGDDPIAWAKDRMGLIDKRMADVLKWSVKDGESWYHMRQAFTHLMFEKVGVLDYVGRYVGGQYTNRNHRGDPDEKAPLELVEPALQRQAMAFIEETLFSDQFFAMSPDVLNHLTSPRWYHEGANINVTVDFPVHEYIGMLQWWNLFDRLMPNTIRRIQDAELKTASNDKFTASEYVQRLQGAVWASGVDGQRKAGGEWSDRRPFISDVRRSLQRQYLDLIEPMVRMSPGMMISPDLHALLQHSLHELSKQIDAVTKGDPALDFASAAHLEACKSRIDRMLTPPLEEYDMMRMMFMYFGQQAPGAKAQGAMSGTFGADMPSAGNIPSASMGAQGMEFPSRK
jgi:hypothetical protein